VKDEPLPISRSGASRMTQVSDPTGTYGFTFDNMGRLTGTSTQYAFFSSRTFTNSYTYDGGSTALATPILKAARSATFTTR
jgi:hypothetical protein